MKTSVRKYEMNPEKRQNILDQIEMLQVLLAVEAGELSEGQASKFLAIDRVSLRKKRIDFINDISKRLKNEI